MVCAFIFLTLFHLYPDTLKFIDSFGKFKNAASVSASREQFIFVSDIQTNQIHKFDVSGKELITFGGSGFGTDALNVPMSLDASNGLDVFVCDYQNNRIQRYDIKLNFISSFNFNTYNLTADNSQKIYYPYGIAFLNTSEIFVLADASTYKIVKLKSLDEVSLLFGSNITGYEKVTDPQKAVRGANLDIWVLDKGTDAVLNFDNYGTFVSKLTNTETSPIISMAYYKNKLYILNLKSIITYDLKARSYSRIDYFSLDGSKNIKDVAMLDEYTALILTAEKVYKYKINN